MSDSVRPHRQQPTRLCRPWDSPGKNTGGGCHALLQGIFPTQGSNPGLLHCRQTLYPLSHQGSPIICRRRLSLIYQVLLIQCSLGVRLGRLSLPSTLAGFPSGSDGKASACNAGDPGLIPGSGRCPGEGNGNPLQCSCLENPRDGGAW